MKKTFKRAAVEAAIKAGKLIKSRFGKKNKIYFKGETNLVTDVDKKAEEIIKKEIKSSFPGHDILAEESHSDGKQVKDFKWIVDPLDGTNNFAHGFPFICVSIALELKKEIILAVVYDPLRDELFLAEKGKGAYLNNRKIYVSHCRKLKKSLLATGFSYNIDAIKENNIKQFAALLRESRGIRRPGAAALDLSYVACGRLDGFWELDLYPWDMAAAALIVTEAGGRVANYGSFSFNHYEKTIIGANPFIFKEMVRVLRKF